MKIYTRTGDDGTTSIFGGGRLPKDHARVQAYGTVDEANAALGYAAALLPDSEWGQRLRDMLRGVQADLFVLGADLATPFEGRPIVPRVDGEYIETLERFIDALEEDLAPLKRFILPGGTQLSAALHLARTVCRRAERGLVAARETVELNAKAVIYLNRLSDLLFVAARWANHMAGTPDVEWLPDKSDTDGGDGAEIHG